MPKTTKPVVLTILDGWGFRAERENNAIALARKPTYDELLKKFPNTLVHTSGPYVGLPEGQMGNSEVGHLNIGAGRIVYMDITRIDLAIHKGEFFQNELLLRAMQRGRQNQLHLLGLVSDGGVHSQLAHLFALLEMAKRNGVTRVFVHAFTDGRDTPPESGVGYLEQLENKMRQPGVGQIASISGRYYAMDRDNRWPRIEKAYRAVVHGEAEFTHTDPLAAMRESYQRGTTDEFVEPVVLLDRDAKPRARVRDGDAAIFFNFRADRARQMTRALTEPGFSQISDPARPKDLLYVSMTQYDKTFTWVPYVFGPQTLENILANVFVREGVKNLRVAETEKYAHVTYFFNGGHESEWEGEERHLVDSPREVPTYDHKPEMSAASAAEQFCEHWRDDGFRFGIINFANADMVGHTGVIPAAVEAVEEVDGRLGEVVAAVHESGGACIVTADHGNAEQMLEPDGSPNTAHSTNPVPLIVTVPGLSLREGGILADVAPTALTLLGTEIPAQMTGKPLTQAQTG